MKVGLHLIKKPWAFTRVPYLNPTIFGVLSPGFLNQVPTLQCVLASGERFPAIGSRGP